MKKGTVEPIRTKKEISAIINYLGKTNIRNQVLFIFGINTGLRVSDILALNVKDVKNKTYIEVVEKKTNKYKRIAINNKLKKILSEYLEDKQDDAPLFLSRKNYRLDASQVYRMLNYACMEVGITSNIGTHTMRKTFGYHHYRQFKDVAMLQEIFNHSSPKITLRYIGINQDEIDKSYKQFEL